MIYDKLHNPVSWRRADFDFCEREIKEVYQIFHIRILKNIMLLIKTTNIYQILFVFLETNALWYTVTYYNFIFLIKGQYLYHTVFKEDYISISPAENPSLVEVGKLSQTLTHCPSKMSCSAEWLVNNKYSRTRFWVRLIIISHRKSHYNHFPWQTLTSCPHLV